MKLTKLWSRIQKQNDGMSLVEILIVVAILSVVVGMSGISISLLYSRDAERAAKSMNTMLEQSRMYCMSREGDFTFGMDTENSECSILPDGSVEELPTRVTYTLASEGSYDISTNKRVEISFDKSTGRVDGISVDGTALNVKDVSLIEMQAENTGGKRATVVLVVATGKHYVEYGS